MGFVSKKWKEFVIKDIFECKTTRAISADEIVDGSVIYITRSAANNGCSGFIVNNPEKLVKGNCITIGAEGKVAFYQKDDFLPGVKVYTLRNSHLNQNIGLFLVTLLNYNCYKYSYGRARILDNIKEEIILLPIDDNALPDWQFMSKYIDSILGSDNNEHSIRNSLKTKNESQNFSLVSQKEFLVKDLFEIERGNITNLNEIESGSTPIVSAYGANQGISYFGNVSHEYEKCFTASLNGSGTGYITFHNYKFAANTDCGVLIPKFQCNIYIGMYLSTVMKKFSYKYTYGRKLTIERLQNEIIKLPVDRNGNPNWEYMEKYIKSLPYADRV